ncbi:MAG: DUF6455 family protein [Pseudomonadota bacterium]
MRNPFTQFDDHAERMNRMSEITHADLAEALIKEQLSPEDYRRAVVSCTRCSQPGACDAWLDAHQSSDEQPPAYCRNRQMLVDLAERQSDTDADAYDRAITPSQTASRLK